MMGASPAIRPCHPNKPAPRVNLECRVVRCLDDQAGGWRAAAEGPWPAFKARELTVRLGGSHRSRARGPPELVRATGGGRPAHVVKRLALHEDREGLGMDAVVLHRVRTCLALHDGLERGHVGHVHA